MKYIRGKAMTRKGWTLTFEKRKKKEMLDVKIWRKIVGVIVYRK